MNTGWKEVDVLFPGRISGAGEDRFPASGEPRALRGQESMPRPNLPGLDDEDHERLIHLGRMVSAVAHEINNRLTSVLGFADLLASREYDADAKRLAIKLRNYTERLRFFSEGLCGFSQKSAGVSTCELNLLVRQAVELAQCTAKTQGIVIALEASEEKVFFQGAPGEIRLGLFVCLDAFVRYLIEKNAQTGTVIEVTITGSHDPPACFRVHLGFSGLLQEEENKASPPSLGIQTAAELLVSQGLSAVWHREQDRGWTLDIESAKGIVESRKGMLVK